MRAVIALLVLASCGENPSLRVEVTHHPDATELVARTTISVYESEVVSCEKVELGDLTAAELTAILVDEIAIAEGEPADALTMSREGPKVIVARGFDATGAFVTAGCEEQGVVGEGDVLAISTELTASVSVMGIGLEDTDPFAIAVTVTDPFVRSLPDRIVSWRVHGADGTAPLDPTNLDITDDSWVPSGPACTNDNGLVRIHPTPPSTIGGFATAVRTSWSTEPPRVFTTFTPINDNGAIAMTPTADQAGNLSARRCASRVSGNIRRLVCLEQDGEPTAIDYTVTTMNGGAFINAIGPNTRQTFPGLVANEVPIGVFSVDRGPSTRDVYAITTKARIIGVFAPSLAADATIKLAIGNVTDVAVLPACGTTSAALLVRVETGTGKDIRTIPIDPDGTLGAGASLTAYASAPTVGVAEGIAINATGCVAELQAGAEEKLRQVGIIDVTGRTGATRNATAAYFDCDAGICTLPLPVPRAGVGFLPADDLHPARIVSASFDATGTVLSVSVLQPDKDLIPRPVELERITAASFPSHVVTGQFDGDGRPDLFWDLANLNIATTNFQLSYAHPVLGQRLSALSGTLQDQIVVDTFAAEVTGDGKDDLVIALQDRPVQPTAHRVLVIPGQVAIPPFNIPQDPSCAAR
jgi:hypothetical protein